MKYEKLTGICEKALRENLCYGCSKLEMQEFRGQVDCNLVQKKKKIDLGEQMKI